MIRETAGPVYYNHKLEEETIMRTKVTMLSCCFFFSFALTAVLFAQDDLKQHPACKYCGMDREKFAHSRFFIGYEDGSSQGTCSIHCAAIEFALQIDKTPRSCRWGTIRAKRL